MKHTKKLTALSLAAVLAFSGSAFAVDPAAITGTDAGSDGSTTVGVVATTQDTTSTNASFTVPLYVTLAVTGDGGGKVWAPAASSYAIKNTAASATSFIGVTGLKVADDASKTWSLVADKATALTDSTKMHLTLNEVVLSSGAAGSPATIDVLGSASKGFAGTTANVPAAIPGGTTNNTKSIALAGTVKSDWAATATSMVATPQWKLTYTISPVDKDGNIISVFTYVGDKKNYTKDASPIDGAFAPGK